MPMSSRLLALKKTTKDALTKKIKNHHGDK
jgi:hypothetical protein